MSPLTTTGETADTGQLVAPGFINVRTHDDCMVHDADAMMPRSLSAFGVAEQASQHPDICKGSGNDRD